MRSIELWTAVAILALSVVSADAGPTAADKFRAAVERKVAPPFATILEGKFKALCVCGPTNEIGVVESFNGIPTLNATCTIPHFTTEGEFEVGVSCYPWTPLAK